MTKLNIGQYDATMVASFHNFLNNKFINTENNRQIYIYSIGRKLIYNNFNSGLIISVTYRADYEQIILRMVKKKEEFSGLLCLEKHSFF